MRYPNLFRPITIRGVTLKNRILSTPMQGPGIQKDGAPTEKAVYFYGAKAKGGAAVVTMGESAVNNHTALRLGVTTDLTKPPFDTMDDFRRYLHAIHRYGALASIQLCHSGSQADPRSTGGKNPISPSGYVREDGVTVDEMTHEQIQSVIQDFANCAATAKMIGFDMIQLHGGHGWLLSQFSSKKLNQRTDEYGGSPENRARFAVELLKAIRARVGDSMIIEYRVSGDERIPGGNTIEDTVEFAQYIQDYTDIIQVSTGTHWVEPTCNYMFPLWYTPHGLNIENAAKVKQAVSNCLVSVVGGISDPDMAEQALAEGKCDLIGMCRALVADPELPNKALEGRTEEIVPCVRCIKCHDVMGMNGSFCTVNPTAMQELWEKELPEVKVPRKVVVIGGGPAGLQAAIAAAERGHQVVLFEQEKSLGGTLRFTEFSQTKQDLHKFVQYLQGTALRLGVDIRLGVCATPALVSAEQPHTVIAAVGTAQKPLPVPVAKGVRVYTPLEAYEQMDALGDTVLVIGGKLTGAELAIDLAKAGKQVTVIGRADTIAAGTSRFYLLGVEEELETYSDRITCVTGTACVEITADGVVTRDKAGNTAVYTAESIVNATGLERRSELAEQFRACALHFVQIGDCNRIADVKQAVLAGYHAGSTVVS